MYSMMSLIEDTDTPDSQYLVASISRMPWSFRRGKSSFLRGTSRFTFKACSELELVSKTLCRIVNMLTSIVPYCAALHCRRFGIVGAKEIVEPPLVHLLWISFLVRRNGLVLVRLASEIV